jgi:4-hydroxybenzoyl-CoA thioesterase
MYEFEWVCRWDHVDPAQRVYFPRLAQACHQAGEQFMVDAGWPYWENPTHHDMHLPVVESGYQFKAPVTVGDHIDIEVEVDMGESSLRLEFTGRDQADGAVVFTGFEQHVCVPTDEDKAIPLPDGLRTAIEDALED